MIDEKSSGTKDTGTEHAGGSSTFAQDRASSGGGTATAAAHAREEKPYQQAGQFFINWLNAKLLKAKGVTVNFNGKDHVVAELRPDGQLRCNAGAQDQLIPIDGNYMEQLLPQVLGK